ncbi:hypothetical protein CGCFRS4_v007327 [Colletotrichum fructicola]|nr:hypothetical protein CGCFRS4_v007327 [Colletotrichum fructicola]
MELEDARKQLAKYCVLLEALRILMDDDYNQTVQNRPIPPGLLGLPRPTPDRRNGIPETFKEFLNALAEIKYYRKRLGKAVKEFMERCKHSILNKDLKETLENILLDIEASKTKSGNDRQEYRDLILKCGVLIGHEGTLFKYLRDANVKIPDCWGAIFHYAERLQSYRTSVRAFFQARTEYDELFANPVANLVPPKTARQVPVEWTLQDLTNYFNSSEYRKNLWGSEDIRKVHAEIQRLLGESREGNEVGFHRIVHAEVALTHWFYSERPGSGIFSESSATRKFFGDYHYVATSKPCCLMCKQFCDLWTLPGFEDCYTKEAEEELLGIYMSMAHKFEENCSLILAKCKPEFARSSFDEEEHFDYDDFRKRTSLAD